MNQPDKKTLKAYKKLIRSKKITNIESKRRADRTLAHLDARIDEIQTGKLAGAW